MTGGSPPSTSRPRPERRSPRRFHPDTREWFAVVEGEVRVEIEGQAPITATRGSLVNIPRQTMYSLETVGAVPSLRFVVNVAKAKTLFPQEAPPPARRRHGLGAGDDQPDAGPLRRVQPAAPEHSRGGREEREVCGRAIRPRRQVGDARALRSREEHAAARSAGQGTLPRRERGVLARVFTGKIRYAFEGQEPFVASEGDVVYVPASTWHATRYIGPDPSCRLSITEYVGNALLLEQRKRITIVYQILLRAALRLPITDRRA